MPNTSKLSKYLKPEHVKDGDILQFLDAGIIIEKEFEQKDGSTQTKPILEITVKVKGESKTYCPNGTTVKILNAAWGTDTEDWVKKYAKVTIVPANNGKDMIIAKPVEPDIKATLKAKNDAVDEEVNF